MNDGNPNNSSDEEHSTEDEEVKLNCLRGKAGVDDSDSWSTDSEDEENSDCPPDIQHGDKGRGIVQFISWQAAAPLPKCRVIRPLPVVLESVYQSGKRDTPLQEEAHESSGDEDESHCRQEDMDPKEQSSSSASGDRLSIEFAEEKGFCSNNSVAEEWSSDVDATVVRKLATLNDITSALTLGDGSAITKRVLSASCLNEMLTKRARASPGLKGEGPSVECLMQPLATTFVVGSYISISSDDDEELDQQLTEELSASMGQETGNTSPVPLLTPPDSPFPAGSEQGTIEWPSNLVVENALMAARATSPSSLQTFEAHDDGSCDNMEPQVRAETIILNFE